MAEEPKVLFEVNASQILAKLHLGALQPCSGYDMNKEFIVNTGIKNDDPKAKPENPGKVEFDLGNSQGEYEIGFVTELEYSFGAQKQVRQILSKIDEYASKLATAEKSKEDESLLAKQKKEDENIQRELKIMLLDKDVKEVLKNAKINVDKLKFDSPKDIENSKKILKDASNNIGKDAEDEGSGRDDSIKKQQEKAIKILETYLNVFVGPDNLKKFDPSKVVMITIPQDVKDSNDSKLVKNYEILQISESDLAKLQKSFETDSNKKNNIEKVCFKTGYTIQIEK